MWHHATATGTICTVAARTDPVGIKLRTRFSAYTLYPLSYGGKKDADKQLCYLNPPLLHSI